MNKSKNLTIAKETIDKDKYKKQDKASLRKNLSKEAYRITMENGTEPPFLNQFFNHFEDGIYVDITTGEPLFLSKDKFNSSCGWPSFSKPISEEVTKYYRDNSFGMERVEVRSRIGDIHLGHVFQDGPKELGGQRYCINSLALHFIPKDKMIEEGYGDLLYLLEEKAE